MLNYEISFSVLGEDNEIEFSYSFVVNNQKEALEKASAVLFVHGERLDFLTIKKL